MGRDAGLERRTYQYIKKLAQQELSSSESSDEERFNAKPLIKKEINHILSDKSEPVQSPASLPALNSVMVAEKPISKEEKEKNTFKKLNVIEAQARQSKSESILLDIIQFQAASAKDTKKELKLTAECLKDDIRELIEFIEENGFDAKIKTNETELLKLDRYQKIKGNAYAFSGSDESSDAELDPQRKLSSKVTVYAPSKESMLTKEVNKKDKKIKKMTEDKKSMKKKLEKQSLIFIN